MELFEAIRRDQRVEGMSVRATARKRGTHGRTVRQARASATPPARKCTVRETPKLTEAMRRRVDEWLQADREAPRKQRHTARRIFTRLQAEMGYDGAEPTIRKSVAARRRAAGVVSQAFAPLAHPPAQEAEVDWYEGDVDFPWGRETVQFFEMRACYSGREFHRAFPRSTQQAFLEGHAAAFEYFGGVFPLLRYDNLTSAARKVLRGRKRVEAERFTLMRSHYVFDATFCLVGEEGAHQKGGVEGGVGRFRRNHLVPVPRVESYEALNELLLDACARDTERRIAGQSQTVTERFDVERGRLRALPATTFDAAEVVGPRVDPFGRVSAGSNRYSVPIQLVGRQVEVRLLAHRVEIRHDGQRVATHERLHGRGGERLELDHYLELLWRKPGALQAARPLQQARERGGFPETYERLWAALRERYGEAEGARQILAVLMLHRQAPVDEVHTAVGLALEHGSYDAGAVSLLLRQLGPASRKDTPLPNLGRLAGIVHGAAVRRCQTPFAPHPCPGSPRPLVPCLVPRARR